jgi:hypothetical protein
MKAKKISKKNEIKILASRPLQAQQSWIESPAPSPACCLPG